MIRKVVLSVLFVGVTILLLLAPQIARSQSGGELHFVLRSEPKTFNPMLVDDEASETIRYLTGGVLIRVNRKTQALEPELATSVTTWLDWSRCWPCHFAAGT